MLKPVWRSQVDAEVKQSAGDRERLGLYVQCSIDWSMFLVIDSVRLGCSVAGLTLSGLWLWRAGPSTDPCQQREEHA